MRDHAHRESEPVEERTHPACVAAGEVVVDSDKVRAFAFECIQVEWQAGDERLAFAGLHLGDLSVVEDDPAHQLDVEMPQADCPASRLSDQREALDQEVVEVLPRLGPLAELVRAGAQRGVVEGLQLGLQLADLAGDLEVLPDLPLIRVDQSCQERQAVSSFLLM